MPELTQIKRFIASPKALEVYLKKIKQEDLIALLDEIEQVKTGANNRKHDKNPNIRGLIYNLSEEEYAELMKKLRLLPHEETCFRQTKKESIIHFISAFSTSLLSSCAGSIGLLTACGVIFSIQTLGILLGVMFCISLMIAAISNYRLRTNNKEFKENKKLLNFQLEILRTYNLNETYSIFRFANELRQKLELEFKPMSLEDLQTTGDLKVKLLEDLKEIFEMFNKKHGNDILDKNLTVAWKDKWEKLTDAINKSGIQKVTLSPQKATPEVMNLNFFDWFKKDTSVILFNIFRRLRSLLTGIVLGAVVGLVILKLIQATGILGAIATTPIGMGILAGAILFVIMCCIMLSLYNMYKKSKPTQLTHNAKIAFGEENTLKESLAPIEENMYNILKLAEQDILGKQTPEQTHKHFHPNTKKHLFLSMLTPTPEQEIRMKELEALFESHLKLTLSQEQKNFLTPQPDLTIKLIKKIKGNIITTQEELEGYFEKTTNLAKSVSRIFPTNHYPGIVFTSTVSTQEETPKNLFELAKNNGVNSLLNEHDLLKATHYAISPDNMTKNNKIIEELIKEIGKRLINQYTKAKYEKGNNLFKDLHHYKDVRKQVMKSLLKENQLLLEIADEYIQSLKNTQKHYAEKEAIIKIKKVLEFNDPLLITPYELIEKKHQAAKLFFNMYAVFSEKYFTFFHEKPHQLREKMKQAFQNAEINIDNFKLPEGEELKVEYSTDDANKNLNIAST